MGRIRIAVEVYRRMGGRDLSRAYRSVDFQVLDVNNKCRGRGLFWGDKKIVLSRDKTILVNLKSIP